MVSGRRPVLLRDAGAQRQPGQVWPFPCLHARWGGCQRMRMAHGRHAAWERDWGTLLLPATRATSPLLRSPSALTPRPQLSAPERGLTPDGFSGHSWSSRELHSLTIHFPTWRKVRGSKGNNHRRRGARPGYVWLGPRNHRDSSIHAASQSGHGHDVKHQESQAQLMTGRVRHLTWL